MTAMMSNHIRPCASATKVLVKCNMLGMLFFLICLTQSVNAGNSTKPPCPPGKDTTYLICPHYDHVNNLLLHQDLPMNGKWEPPLQDTFGTIYNSCEDGLSIYIFQRDYPGCPSVQDTVRFELQWDPCSWELENVCYIEDSILFTIPAYPGEHEATTYWFNWHFPGDTFNLDTSYDLSVFSQSETHIYDLHIFLDESPFCWWTFGELLAWDFYSASTDVPCMGSEPPCPVGKDTTIFTCPLTGYTNNLLPQFDLPAGGQWEPPLQEPVFYNDCLDSNSFYTYITSTPGCPDVVDTVHFELLWDPPCDLQYDACYTNDSFSVTIFPHPAFDGNHYSLFFEMAVGHVPLIEHCSYTGLNPDTINVLSCGIDWNNDEYPFHCVTLVFFNTVMGCDWWFPIQNEVNDWDCDVVQCDAVAVDPISTFESVKVYPIPTDDVLFIDIEKPITEVLISGIDGRLFKHINHPGSNQIWVADLEPGWYLLSIFEGHQWYHARIVK